jgi:hypothetical protein
MVAWIVLDLIFKKFLHSGEKLFYIDFRNLILMDFRDFGRKLSYHFIDVFKVALPLNFLNVKNPQLLLALSKT